MVETIRQELTELEPESIKRVKVSVKKPEEPNYVWTQEFGLEVGAFSYLILPEEREPVGQISSIISEEEIEPEDRALNSEKLSKITLGIVAAILAVAVIVFIGKMLMQRSPSDEEKNPKAYAQIFLN